MGSAKHSIDEVMAALDAEIDSQPPLLPPSIVYPALSGRRQEVAEWLHKRLSGQFLPTPQETVAVNKARQGVRPVAVWDLPSRVAYRALASRLDKSLGDGQLDKRQWREFLQEPLQHEGRYVVASDIAACYENIDHGLMSDELLVRTGDHVTVEAVSSLLLETGGRAFGLPQQSPASDVLAEAVLDRLERALVRHGLQVARYNDDFRFTCRSWSEAVRSIEVLSEEARLIGLTMNDMKTIAWRRSKYEESLNEAESLRQKIADEAELNLANFIEGSYDDFEFIPEPDPDDVNYLAAVQVLERWAKVAGRRTVAARRTAEQRAAVDLLPFAMATLGAESGTTPDILAMCMKLLRFERTVTPAVARYLDGRSHDEEIVAAFDRLLRSRSYLNGWQTWWLQQPVAWLPAFASGRGASSRMKWAQGALASAEHAPVLRAHACLTLARHGHISYDDLLTIYNRSSDAVRPALVAAMAHLAPAKDVKRSLTGDSELHRWVYEWTASGA
jgi:hypothetical protein